jgi:uncharacterized protein
MPDGDQHYVLALFSQVQGVEVIGTGLCVAIVHEPIVAAVGQVCLSHETEKAVEFVELLSGTKGSQIVGFIVENSTIGSIRFEVAAALALEEGDVVFTKIESREVFYQILAWLPAMNTPLFTAKGRIFDPAVLGDREFIASARSHRVI